jgi:hypothetical protein
VRLSLSTFSLLTFSFTLALASSILVFAVPQSATPAVVATPKPTAAPGKASTKNVCDETKSKWAHLKCEEFNSSAPGDEYFGRMKMSYLGIDNTYKDGVISAGAYTTDPHLIAKLDFATEALRRWAAKYPNDPELARSYYLAVQVLRKVYTQSEQQVTWEFMHLLVVKYGNTYFGKTEKAVIAQGYTEHWFGLAQLCPTPLPLGVLPEATPNATPEPSPAPGHPAVDLITPPCVQPSPVPDQPDTLIPLGPSPTLSPAPMLGPSPNPHVTKAPNAV